METLKLVWGMCQEKIGSDQFTNISLLTIVLIYGIVVLLQNIKETIKEKPMSNAIELLRESSENGAFDNLNESLETLIRGAESFDDTIDEKEQFQIKPTDVITVAIIRSESGDLDLYTSPGALTPREIAVNVFLSQPQWWGDMGALDIEEVRYIKLP